MTFEPNMKYDLEILSYLYGIDPEDEEEDDEYNYDEDYPDYCYDEDDFPQEDDQA